jgi:mannose-1-phosphate guanylyltransferase
MSTIAETPRALVLAGGDGTRLQALTRLIAGAPIPKQYCRIAGDRSLLEATLGRVAPLVGHAGTLVIVNENHLHLARPQLARVPDANVVVQPRNLDTGPGLVLGLLTLAERAPDAIVGIFPSDHHVRNEAAFRRQVAHMFRLVEDRHPERLALLGIRPDRPDSELGYIAPGARLAGATSAFEVAAFHEKPARRLAADVIRRGGLWNSFVMVGRVRRLLALLRQVRPVDVAGLEPLPTRPEALARRYEELAPWNFSRDFLAHIAPHLLVVRADDLGWSDWGTPEAIERTFAAMGWQPAWRAPALATG